MSSLGFSGAPGDLETWPRPLSEASILLFWLGVDLIFLNGVEVVLFSSDGGMCLSSLYPDPLFTSRNEG